MATRFVNVDRLTPLLFPPDLRDWVRDDDLAHFVLDAVDALGLEMFRVNRRGSGSEQYPPKMMLSLLIYGYATGTFSSRALEQLTYSHVSVRYVCANTHPDHDTISTFRRENKALLEETFVKVLELACELKLAKVGTVAIDGTRIAANASKHSCVSYGRAGAIIERLQGEVESLLAKAEAADSVPLQDGLSIPAEITRREARQAKLRAARKVIEARALEQSKSAQVEFEAKVARRQAQRENGEAVRGREPHPPSKEPESKAQYNFTDPESRIMKAGSGQHFEQAYNAQAAVDTDSLLIMGQRVSDAPNDKRQLQPTVASIPARLGRPEEVLVDSGFYSEAQVRIVEGRDQLDCDERGQRQVETVERAVERDELESPGWEQAPSGTMVYVAMGRMAHDQPLWEFEVHPEPPVPSPEAPVAQQMHHRLKTAKGKALYKQRKHTVEPVFGIIKEVLGFRRFSLRGHEKVSLEWTLVCLSWNIKRLHKLGMPAKMAEMV